MKNIIWNRLREPSSWAGFAMILATAAQAIATKDPAMIGAVLSGVVAVLVPEGAAQK